MTFVAFAGLIMSTLLVLPMMRSPQAATKAELEESIGTVLKRAFKDPSYTKRAWRRCDLAYRPREYRWHALRGLLGEAVS